MIVPLGELMAWAEASRLMAEREGFVGVEGYVAGELRKLRTMKACGVYQVSIVPANDYQPGS